MKTGRKILGIILMLALVMGLMLGMSVTAHAASNTVTFHGKNSDTWQAKDSFTEWVHVDIIMPGNTLYLGTWGRTKLRHILRNLANLHWHGIASCIISVISLKSQMIVFNPCLSGRFLWNLSAA